MLTYRIRTVSASAPPLSSLLFQYAQWLPAFPLLAYWIISQFLIPLPFYAHYDAEMAYAFDSLAVFVGRIGYRYIDHPGTPVDLVGSAIYALTIPVAWLAGQPFPQFHVTHPEVFLSLARTLLTVTSVVVAVLLFRVSCVGSWLNVLGALAVSLSFYALHPLGFESLVYWSQNSWPFPFGTLLLLLLSLAVRAKVFSWKGAFGFGFAAGVLTAATLFFVTWAFGVGLAFGILGILESRDWRQVLGIVLLSGIAAILGFVAATLAILPEYPRFLDWVGRLTFNQGIYGAGQAGIASLESLSAHFVELWDSLPVLIAATGIVLLALAVLFVLQHRSNRKESGTWAVALALGIQLALTLFLMLKHPGVYYMLGLAAIFPVLLLAMFALMGSSRVAHSLRLVVGTLILLGVVSNFRHALDTQGWQRSDYAAAAESIQRHLVDYAAATGKDPNAVVTVWTYGVPSPCYVRMFGNDLGGNPALGAEVARLCPNQISLNIWTRVLYDAAGTVLPADAPWDVMIANKTVVDPGKWGGYGYLTTYGRAVTDTRNGLVFVFKDPSGNGSRPLDNETK